ncbi:hypothetical protein SAMN02745671_01409 [Anaerovibrio lipolyticus DSM 3074]|uniref:Uncharacterized protein n=1 Tax=Anaerovibrio lipolyticus DSM 3074 TaxID=1120997 RepID=A0A1M6DAJ7_9FIRM|nr:hypothetical protein [Anaerovibrio lipolyticus]SHI70243.1 hypothetical protein SAMN02745671_01409 [Anaerovibrio lipolyticus DSM 3074]
MNVETGSHVKTRSCNAILALGHKNEKKIIFEGAASAVLFNIKEASETIVHARTK